ncbi:MAG: TraR/DksA C4-type zinc finger protein [Candidatus Dormibacteraeota bacterium]|nr:TraR/DksA C4-type zinc finger protein [Candidatus Dormibacteraeota bacterium]
MTREDQERARRLEANRSALTRLANQFEADAGLDRPIAEIVGDVVSRDYEDTDFAAVLADREVSDSLMQVLEENREQVERALIRLTEGKYGECEDCGEPIATERLRFRPEATRCVVCQSRWDRLNRRSA